MAQLSDDCFAFGGTLLPVAEMERLIAERVADILIRHAAPIAAVLAHAESR